jgi:hypothetical protein
MLDKRNCDVCNKDLEDESSVYHYNAYDKTHNQYPICFKCYRDNMMSRLRPQH